MKQDIYKKGVSLNVRMGGRLACQGLIPKVRFVLESEKLKLFCLFQFMFDILVIINF